MASDLLPMSLGDVFDEAFDLYKRNFALFAGIVAAVHVPTTLAWSALYYGLRIDRLVQTAESSEQEAVAALGVMAVYLLAMMAYTFVYVVQNGALTVAISDRYLGRPATLGSAYRRTFSRLFRLLATWGFIFIILCGALTVFFLVMLFAIGLTAAAMGPSAAGGAFSIVMALLFMVFTAGVSLLLVVGLGLFITQTVIIEGLSFHRAIQRNWQLVAARFPRIFGAAALLCLILGALLLTLTSSVEWLLEALVYPWFSPPSFVQSVVSETLLAVVWMFLQPFGMTCLTLLYYDMRVRREGFDLALLERQVQPRAIPEAPV